MSFTDHVVTDKLFFANSVVIESVAQGPLMVENRIRIRYQQSPHLPLRHIICLLRERILILRGRVPTYYLKQLAQSIGSSFDGVDQIINELQVDFPVTT